MVLDYGVDLSQVFRGGCLLHPDDTGRELEGGFVMQVQRAEPRERYLFGDEVSRVSAGEVSP